jgi:UPF0755 protein
MVRSKQKAYLLYGIILTAICIGVLIDLLVKQLTSAAGGLPYTLEVKSGDSLVKVANTLEKHHIVRNAKVLRFLMQEDGTANHLQEGLYECLSSS